jgi:hypothetical protein
LHPPTMRTVLLCITLGMDTLNHQPRRMFVVRRIGNDGVVRREEARRILSRLARGTDPNVRIKALESLQKLETVEATERAAQNEQELPTEDEIDAALICALPVSGKGAAMILGGRFNAGFYRISSFVFLKEVAPVVSRKFPENWARWRARSEHPELTSELKFIDECASGPSLTATN